MSAPEQTFSSQSAAPIARPARRVGGCLALAAFVLGLVIGVALPLLYFAATQGDRPALPTPQASAGAVVVQLSRTYIAQLIQKDIGSSGVPGTITNVQVAGQDNDQLIVTGNDSFTVFGVNITSAFTLFLQPLASSCQFRVHVLRADLGNIPVTGFVASFEDRFNQQLRFGPSGLPPGFGYCTTGVRTSAQGLSLIYSATPRQGVTTPGAQSHDRT